MTGSDVLTQLVVNRLISQQKDPILKFFGLAFLVQFANTTTNVSRHKFGFCLV